MGKYWKTLTIYIYFSQTHEIVPFEDLNRSTVTMMVYSNLSFDLMKVPSHIPVTSIINPPLTRKKKRIDKKKLKSAYGSVISLQYGLLYSWYPLEERKEILVSNVSN